MPGVIHQCSSLASEFGSGHARNQAASTDITPVLLNRVLDKILVS